MRLRNNPDARRIPPGAVKVADKASDAIAYLYIRNGAPCAIGYHAKAAKPDWCYRFRSEAERERTIKTHFEGRRAQAQFRAEQRAKDTKPHKLQIGHLLESSWGYDQTNVEFWEVTAIVGAHTVEIREVAQVAMDHSAGDQWRTVPKPGEFVGEPQRVRVRQNTVRVHDCARAYLWDGRPMHASNGH